MNKENIKKSGIYFILSQITGKKEKTIKMYFWRNGLKVNNGDNVLDYILKNK